MWSFFSRDFSKDFPYEIGEHVPGLENKSVWQLHKAKKKGASEELSVFVYDVKNGSEIQLEIAKASVKRLKTLRHPSILTYLDSFESDKFLYLATEYVEPLESHITQLSNDSQQRDLYLAWGIFQITRALSFLNNDGNLRHNNVCLSSVFVNSAGEWFLGGLEYVSGQNEALPIKILPELEKYEPPEKTDPNKQNQLTKCSTDMWGLGCLIWEAFNGSLPRQSSLKQLDNIPKQLSSLYCELVSANPASRPNPADVITRCRRQGGYFKNDLVDVLLFLEEIQIKDRTEKSRFFGALTSQLEQFPTHVCRLKILPQLVTAFEYGDAGAAVLAPMFKLGRLLDESEYQKIIVPCVVRLFASTDRATRIRLLQQLEQFIGHLQSATVNDAIFSQIALGFTDTNATVREQTVKSVIHLAPKLNYNNLNVEVLRHFARLQSKDEQGGIRTNTSVCLGKIAQHLHPQIRQKVLISAFIRAMRDPFAPSRSAGVLALAATQQYFLLSEVASRILPALCQLTIDPEKQVRENAFRAIKGFLGKLEKVSEDPSLRESMEADVHTATPSLSNAAATWAGWAVSAVTAKFYRSQSDTVRSSSGGNYSTTHGKSLSKTSASLEQPSSSSLSTTTSSVTSMTSLEQEESKGQESVSDYEHWEDNEHWGELESSRPSVLGRMNTVTTSTTTAAASLSTTTLISPVAMPSDGWDIEEWGSLDEAPELESPGEDVWSGISPDLNKDKSEVSKDIKEEEADWKDSEWEPLEETSSSAKLEEARKKREERKLHRQRELEARRANRSATGGPMKLAAKKI